MGDNVQILSAMVVYMLVTVGIGVFYARKSNENTENYFLGGRSLGPWITAMSAEASGHRPCHRYICQLAGRRKAAAQLLHRHRRRDYHSGILQQPL